jgi:hypothetical protein
LINNSEHSHVGMVVLMPNKWHKEPELYVLELTDNIDEFIDPFAEGSRKGICLFRLLERLHAFHGGLITHYPLKKPLEGIPIDDIADAVRRVHAQADMPKVINSSITQFILKNFSGLDPRRNLVEFVSLSGPRFVSSALTHIAVLKEGQIPPPIELTVEWIKRQDIWDKPNLVRLPEEALKIAMATVGRNAGNPDVKVVQKKDVIPPPSSTAQRRLSNAPPMAVAPPASSTAQRRGSNAPAAMTAPPQQQPYQLQQPPPATQYYASPQMQHHQPPPPQYNPALNPAMMGSGGLSVQQPYGGNGAQSNSGNMYRHAPVAAVPNPQFAAPNPQLNPQLAAMEREMKRLEEESAKQQKLMAQQAKKLEAEQKALEAAMLASEMQMKQLQGQTVGRGSGVSVANEDDSGISDEADDDMTQAGESNLAYLTGAGLNFNHMAHAPKNPY